MRRQCKHTNKQSMIWHPPRGPCPLHYPLRNQRCFAHNPLRGSTTQRKLTTPDSPKRLQRQHTHKRHATPAPAHTTPAHSDLLRTACAPTSTHSNGFCVIWACISSGSSSSNIKRAKKQKKEEASERTSKAEKHPKKETPREEKEREKRKKNPRPLGMR